MQFFMPFCYWFVVILTLQWNGCGGGGGGGVWDVSTALIICEYMNLRVLTVSRPSFFPLSTVMFNMPNPLHLETVSSAETTRKRLQLK